MMEPQSSLNPFPGLRPFEAHESHLFFGREGQSDELIRRLGKNHFLAVVGTSGSGKSSLVRAGLLPALHGGFMADAGSHWRMAIFRPSGDPLGNLADALYRSGATTPTTAEWTADPDLQILMIQATLRRSELGIVEAVKQSGTAGAENLLIVVDQFEELFRFKAGADGKDAHNDAAAFVKLLLHAAQQTEAKIYVVITMRSNYLGECAQFRDLPEAINANQYLIPRLTRDQRRQAITGPIAVAGGQISERLVQQLLNDMGDNPDQLPILQHALRRTWDYWQRQHQPSLPIDFADYEQIGGMAHALSVHADEAFNDLAENQSQAAGKRRQLLAEKLFRCITELGPDNREIRRPTKLKDICAIVAADEMELIEIIEVFRREGRCFLVPPAHTPLTGESLIDVSHESLIRQWDRLNDWVQKEAEDRKMYARIVDAAERYFYKKVGGLWHDPDLEFALNWRAKSKTSAAWAKRYQPSFEPNKAFDFLTLSQEERDNARR